MYKYTEYLFAYISVLLISLFSSCCNNPSRGGSVLPTIDIEEAVRGFSSVKLSEYCSDIEYIPLMTGDSCLLSCKEEIAVIGNLLVLYESIPPTYCRIFSLKGDFIGNLGDFGNSDIEYLHIDGLSADLMANMIYIQSGKKILAYDYRTLEFKDSFPIGNSIPVMTYRLPQFGCFAGRFILSGSHYFTDNPTLFVLDKSDNIIMADSMSFDKYEMEPTQTGTPGTLGMSHSDAYLWTYNDTLSYISRLADTLYGYDLNFNKYPRFFVDAGKYKLKKDMSNVEESAILQGTRIFENNRLLICQMIMRHSDRVKFNPSGSRIGTIVFDKLKSQTLLLPCAVEDKFRGSFENDLDNGAPFRVMATCGNKMYQIISALDFITLADKYNSPKMKEVAAGLNDESNPVLVAVTLK